MMALAPTTISFDPDFASPVEWAEMYRRAGIQVIPGVMPSESRSWKRPKLAEWTPLHDAFATDLTFARWYGETGEHCDRPNMGVVTGRGNGLGNLVVIDLDTHKHEAARTWWNSVLWEHNGGDELKTWTQTTGGGGRQIFLRAPAHWRAPTNRTSAGVDIRGQGGFAVLPPSLHDSGRTYDWDKGLAPYDGLEILDAPQWLLDAIDQFIEENGGTKGEAHERTPNPAGDTGPFGRIADGRETYMRNVVWAAVIDWYRESPIKPPVGMWPERMELVYADYERRVENRFPQLPPTEGLERDDRGPSLFRQKWKRAMGKWDTEIAEAAKERPLEEAKPVAEPIPEAVLAPPPPDAPEPEDRGIATRFEWIDPSSIPPRAWIYGRHYIRKFVSTTVAPGGVGKTALGVVEALAITTGKPLLGIEPEETAKVWLWNGEDPMEELQRRVMAAAMHYGIVPSHVDGRLFVDTGRETPIVIAEKTRDGAAISVPVVEKVIHTIRANKIGLMIIDPFVACHRVTENDNSEIERVAKAWAQIADATNCAIELVHHVRKTNGNEVSVEDGRGATALLAAARSARALNRMTADEAARAGVTEPGLYFRTDNGKANLAPPSAVATWYHLASIDLDNDTPATAESPARPSDKVGVVTRWEWPDPTADVTASDMEMVRAAVRQGMWREDPQAAQWVGRCIIQTLGWDADEAANTHKAKALISMWLKSGALETYRAKDPETRKEKSFVRAGNFKD